MRVRRHRALKKKSYGSVEAEGSQRRYFEMMLARLGKNRKLKYNAAPNVSFMHNQRSIIVRLPGFYNISKDNLDLEEAYLVPYTRHFLL